LNDNSGDPFGNRDATAQFSIGVNAGAIRYQVSSDGEYHRFYSGAVQGAAINSSGITLPGGGTPLGYYQETTWTTTFSGARSISTTFRLVRVGKMVTMSQTTQNTHGNAVTNDWFRSGDTVPAGFRAALPGWNTPITITNPDGLNGLGELYYDYMTALIHIRRIGIGTTTWVSGQNCGWQPICVSWTVAN